MTIYNKDKYVQRYMNISAYLTNRFHVAVRLFSNGSQMMSKCGKNKKVAHEAQLDRHENSTDVI